MRSWMVLLILLVSSPALADLKWRHTEPAGYAAQPNTDVIAYAKVDGTTFCMLGLYKPRAMVAAEAAEVADEWKIVVEKHFTPSAMKTLPKRTTKRKLRVLARSATMADDKAKHYGEHHVVIAGKALGSVLAMSNTAKTFKASCAKDAKALLDSLALEGEVTQPAPVARPGAPSVVGAWGTSSSATNNGFSMGSQKFLYDLEADGTFTFRFESWGGHNRSDYWIIVEESGKYTLAGDKLTIIPTKASTTERGKKAIKSIQKRVFEKVTYTYQLHHFEGIDTWALVLTPPAPTKRDVAFSTIDQFSKSYVYEANKQIEWEKF